MKKAVILFAGILAVFFAACATTGVISPQAEENYDNAIAGSITAWAEEEYILYCSGGPQGTVTIQRDRAGKIIITSRLIRSLPGSILIDSEICPLIPAWIDTIDVFVPYTATIIIEGNTMTDIYSNGRWRKTVVDGNTTTETWSNGSWNKTVINGNTTTWTASDGSWNKTVINGNTTTWTSSDGWQKTVVDGNTTTTTWSDGWAKTVVDGNTTTTTRSNGSWSKTVVDKQGYNIFITLEKGSGR
jgi:hypothetical protein